MLNWITFAADFISGCIIYIYIEFYYIYIYIYIYRILLTEGHQNDTYVIGKRNKIENMYINKIENMYINKIDQ